MSMLQVEKLNGCVPCVPFIVTAILHGTQMT